jgi:uncharacterized membrane protein
MADLIVLGFESEDSAEAVRTLSAQLMKENLLELEDAVVVIRTREGKIKINQALNLTAAGAMGGALWGLLIGTLFLNPIFGLAIGAASGALSGALTDIGINDDTIRKISETLQPGTSALFVLVRRATPDRVIEALRSYNPSVIKTSLTYEKEADLIRALAPKPEQANAEQSTAVGQ